MGAIAHPQPSCELAGIILPVSQEKRALRGQGTRAVTGEELSAKNERTQVGMTVVRDLEGRGSGFTETGLKNTLINIRWLITVR